MTDAFLSSIHTKSNDTSADQASKCEEIQHTVSDFIGKNCEPLANSLQRTDATICACDQASPVDGVDLIILIDQSGSMDDIAPLVADASAAAIESAKDKCGAENLRVAWFTNDGSDYGVSIPRAPYIAAGFTQTQEQYLRGLGHTGPFAGNDFQGNNREEGAKSINDLARMYDWRPGVCRAIFYVSDERFGDYGRTHQQQMQAVNAAVAECLTAGVKVFAHYEDGGEHSGTRLAENTEAYETLCNSTSGRAEIGGSASQALYEGLLGEAICEACITDAGCAVVDWPDIKPCIDIRWGQSDCDGIESDDHEVLCLSICNCYENVTFSDVKIGYLWLTDENGEAPPALPDGTPSGRIYPLGPICFGDIGPCVDGEPTCVHREAIVVLRGVKPGKYNVSVGGLCFDIKRSVFVEKTTFEMIVCAS